MLTNYLIIFFLCWGQVVVVDSVELIILLQGFGSGSVVKLIEKKTKGKKKLLDGKFLI